MKANQMSKVCASSHEYPHVEKIKNLCEQNFKGTVAQPTVTAKELTSRKKELVRQSQIVQSVMQDCQYDLNHLLPV